MENVKVVESHMKLKKRRQIVLFPLPLQGHINPMFQLANILYSKGFSITIVHTHFNSPNTSNYPHFTFHVIEDGLLETSRASASSTLTGTTDNVIELLSVLNVKCLEPFRECLGKLLAEGAEETVSVLVTDAVWHFTRAVSEGMKIPRIVLRTSSVCSFNAFAAFPLLRQKGYFPIQDSMLEAPIQELPPLKVKDLPVIKTQDPETLHQLVSGIVNQTKTSSGLIWNSFEELEKAALITLAQEFPIPIFPIGPFHKYFTASSSSLLTQDQSCISWLDNRAPNSVLYVSFGSIAAINKTEFLEVAWGLANSSVPFLWVVRPGLVHGSGWLEHLPDGFTEMVRERGLIVKWAPQQEVLAHPATGGFWTHNGWNSTLESICEGVPMICQPCFGDQKVNARYVGDVWKIGVVMEKELERGEVEKVIKRVMMEGEGKEIRERVLCLKEKVELCLSGSGDDEGAAGSSYQSLDRLINYILSF